MVRRTPRSRCPYATRSWNVAASEACDREPSDVLTSVSSQRRTNSLMNTEMATHGEIADDAFDLSIDAAVAVSKLNLTAGKRMAYDALETSRASLGDTSPVVSLASAIIAQITYEEGDYRHCESALQTVFKMRGDRTLLESLVRAYPIAARIAVHRGHHSGAVQSLNEGAAVGKSGGSVRLTATCLLELANLYVDVGDLDKARHSLGRLTDLTSNPSSESCEHGTRIEIERGVANARVTLATAPSHQAATVLRRLHHDALDRKDQHLAATLELRVIEALEINGETAEAQTILTAALRASVNTGLFQTWIDGGPYIHRLLRHIYGESEHSQNELMPFLRTLIRRVTLRGSAPGARMQLCKDLLSSRESDILQLMSRGLTNKGIARDLSIAPETVKTHAKHIFEKLKARTRAEAVARISGWSPI
jgi:ATP/maltotriose-dependent transcriptional regulator MalT